MIEDGAMIKDGKVLKSRGGVVNNSSNYFQSFVSVKRGFEPYSFTDLGHHNYIASFTNIGHNCQLGYDNYIAPHVSLGGYVKLGHNVYLGMGVIVTQNVKIGNWVKVAAGNVIKEDIPSNTYVDSRGRRKRNKDAKVLPRDAGSTSNPNI